MKPKMKDIIMFGKPWTNDFRVSTNFQNRVRFCGAYLIRKSALRLAG